MVEISQADWKLYRKKLADWQESYMEKLCEEYRQILNNGKPASDQFWALEKRINRDKKDTGVIAEIRRSTAAYNIVELLAEGAITFDDLTDFSDEFQERIRLLARINQ